MIDKLLIWSRKIEEVIKIKIESELEYKEKIKTISLKIIIKEADPQELENIRLFIRKSKNIKSIVIVSDSSTIILDDPLEGIYKK